jgi:hypothetical protein
MTAPQLAKAEVVISGQTIEVQFNPVSLQVEITNSINQQGEAGGTNQVSTQSSAKLGLDLLFDTSAAGEDVRNKTRPLRAAVRAPAGAQGGGGAAAPGTGAAFVPPLVTFQWGTFTFSGIAESFRETLDFFSSDGVPLRATVAMSLKEQAGEFTALERDNPRGSANTSAFEVPAELGGGGAAGVAALGGDLRAARAIASLNGEASLRFSAGVSLSVGGGVQLREAVSFAGASAGVSLGAGLGVSAGAGISAGIGVSAPTLRFDAGRLSKPAPARQLATDAGAGFAIDGRALPRAGAGLRSEVGAGASLSSKLRFEN